MRVAPGLLLALLVAAVASVLGKLVPIVGGPVFGIVLGAIAAATISGLRAERWADGYAVASKPVLQLSIVVLKKLAFGQGRRNLEELSERLAELPAGQEIVRTVAARTARSPTIRSGCSPTGAIGPDSWPMKCSNGGLATCWSQADHDFSRPTRRS